MSIGLNRKNYLAPYEMIDPWEEVLLGDKELFKEMTEPLIPTLLDTARRDIKRERVNGNLSDKLLPEELVGDTLVQAWVRRFSRSPREPLKDWLLSMQRWALRLIVLEEKDWMELKAVSLESPAKPKTANNENDEWDWVTPQAMTRECWRDVIADENSIRHAV